MIEGYSDLGDLPEDQRIAIIAAKAASGKIVGVIVEDQEKADRYCRKLRHGYKVRIVGLSPGPVANTICIRVGPAES